METLLKRGYRLISGVFFAMLIFVNIHQGFAEAKPVIADCHITITCSLDFQEVCATVDGIEFPGRNTRTVIVCVEVE